MKKLFRRFRKKRQPTPQPSDPLLGMLNMLAVTEEDEIACDQVFAALGEFAELAQRGGDVAHLMPLVAQHLHLCPDCREEYEALIAILAAEEG
ncbi:MAG: hypothetical protein K0B06_09250 [Brevefilum sp.]|nr:hypothetical protein [Brevefilum sp.]